MRNKIYVKDRSLLGSTLFVLVVFNVIIFICMLLADAFSITVVEIVAPKYVQELDLNNKILINYWVLWVISLPVQYVVYFVFLNYLDNGCEQGVLKLPYTEKYNDNSGTFKQGLFNYF